jgi:hypothetical protein
LNNLLTSQDNKDTGLEKRLQQIYEFDIVNKLERISEEEEEEGEMKNNIVNILAHIKNIQQIKK